MQFKESEILELKRSTSEMKLHEKLHELREIMVKYILKIKPRITRITRIKKQII